MGDRIAKWAATLRMHLNTRILGGGGPTELRMQLPYRSLTGFIQTEYKVTKRLSLIQKKDHNLNQLIPVPGLERPRLISQKSHILILWSQQCFSTLATSKMWRILGAAKIEKHWAQAILYMVFSGCHLGKRSCLMTCKMHFILIMNTPHFSPKTFVLSLEMHVTMPLKARHSTSLHL